jgi:o-succinylbenzoate synthase
MGVRDSVRRRLDVLMSIHVHRYELVPRRALGGVALPGVRHGALLRVDGGFADLHPWPELGDVALEEQLARLERGVPAPQTLVALGHASVDAAARERGESLFAGLEVPASHWSGADAPPEFDTVKVKGMQEVDERLRMRIDFNAQLSAREFFQLARTLPAGRIDFIEDPCPYDEQVWSRLRRETGLRLALDRFDGVADVLVHKPALQARFPATDAEVVVTSYMDHPVGQVTAAYVAASHKVSQRCGLMTHVLFEENAFSARLRCDGARLLAPEGTGIGFDDLLEELPWTTLR